MPGLEDSSPRLATINPSNLVSKADAVVEPRAIAQLTDAFRQGFITADDIHERVGQNAQARKKVELQMLNEAGSPEAQAARAAGTSAATNQALLGSAQAKAGLPLVDPSAQLAASQIEKQQAYEKYPAAAFFEKFAPALGLEVPTTADGKPDYAKMAKVGAQLASWQTDKALAKEEEKNIETVANADGTGYISRTKSGIPLTPEQVRSVQARANKPFQMLQPGAVDVTPKAAPAVSTAQVSTGAVQSTAMPNAEPNPNDVVVEPAAGAAPAAPVPAAPAAPVVQGKSEHPAPGVVIPGIGVSLGPPKAKDMQEKAPTEAQQRAQLALARFEQSNDMQSSLKAAGYDPTSIGSWINGMLPQILKSGDRKAYEAATDAWSQGLLRLESGAAISRQEKSWYEKSFFPQVKDPPSVVAQKEVLRHDVEKMAGEIAQAGAVVSPESARHVKEIYAQAGQLSASAPAAPSRPGFGPVVNIPGKPPLQKGPDGRYYFVQ